MCLEAHSWTPAEGCWRKYSPGGRSFAPSFIAREDDLSVEVKKYHDLSYLWVLHASALPGGKIQKSADVRALLTGGGMPQRRPIY